jgi:hypothetical protein
MTKQATATNTAPRANAQPSLKVRLAGITKRLDTARELIETSRLITTESLGVGRAHTVSTAGTDQLRAEVDNLRALHTDFEAVMSQVAKMSITAAPVETVKAAAPAAVRPTATTASGVSIDLVQHLRNELTQIAALLSVCMEHGAPNDSDEFHVMAAALDGVENLKRAVESGSSAAPKFVPFAVAAE